MVSSMFKSIRLWAILLIIIAVLSLVYLFTGYSTLTVQASDTSTVLINGTPALKGSGKIKLRPGVYKITINSRDFEATEDKYSLFIYTNKNITENNKPRNFEKIINTALGTNENTYRILDSKAFGIYYAALVYKLNQEKYVVLKYQDGAWGLLYEGPGNDQSYLWKTPTSISQYLKGIEINAGSQ